MEIIIIINTICKFILNPSVLPRFLWPQHIKRTVESSATGYHRMLEKMGLTSIIQAKAYNTVLFCVFSILYKHKRPDA